MTVLYLGLVNWIATTILVEGAIFDRPRERLRARGGKVGYLVGCHLCTGTWVGLVLALVAGGPFSGFAGVVLSGLLYKAVGHVALEVTALMRRAARA